LTAARSQWNYFNGWHGYIGTAWNMRISSLGTFALVSFLLLAPASVGAREIVRFSGYSVGTIVIKTNQRRLYYVIGADKAIRYPVGVGRRGMAWTGTAVIDGKYIKPGWSAPDSIRKDYSRLPAVVPGGSSHNPMGAAAMTLSGGGEYAIHGTNNPGSVGGFVSHGCIRMYNSDVLDLYKRVSYGTPVVVLR
jgi:lipoprotein-anchoring transpeptidase ErfK/SrfK